MFKKITYFIFTLFLIGFISPAVYAQEVKDSYYFMKDDGEFSDEEKDEEALYIYGVCENNVYQRTYFDCACIAGAYRQERDKEDLIPQGNLLNSIFSNKKKDCSNTAVIAGDAYDFCTGYAKSFRKRESNNEKYCECVANTMAKSFAKEPTLVAGYISNMQTQALLSCKDKVDLKR